MAALVRLSRSAEVAEVRHRPVGGLAERGTGEGDLRPLREEPAADEPLPDEREIDRREKRERAPPLTGRDKDGMPKALRARRK